ncbi:glycoside hydrolase family 108 protein [Candidatus Binatus soli]|uniref:glycoside hydrolase family 108 protein n=1 Tax=Candidatus Binatus soli TaxID=1953413 RepID=UPI003D14849C
MDPSSSVPDTYSPEFLTAVKRVLANEGGYSSNPADPGGATRFGISARSHPGLNIATLTRDAAVEIYWREWWLRFGFARLPAAAAAKTFDLAVNMGAGHAIECLQRALRACGRPVTEDGVIGAATAAEAARADPAALMAALRSELAAYYRLVAAKADQAHRDNNEKNKFIKGWLNRAYAR